MSVTRRKALIGVGAVVVSASLPVPTPETVPGLTPLGLDALAAIWGIKRFGEHLSGIPLRHVSVEDDDSLRNRLREEILRVGFKPASC